MKLIKLLPLMLFILVLTTCEHSNSKKVTENKSPKTNRVYYQLKVYTPTLTAAILFSRLEGQTISRGMSHKRNIDDTRLIDELIGALILDYPAGFRQRQDAPAPFNNRTVRAWE